jgi:alpha-1,3-mannosyltransferase
VFYDNWVARDINGTALENAPFESVFHHAASADRFQRHLPVQVQSCWNGVAVLDPAPFYAPAPVRFRMARIAQNECSASECSLICNDYWDAGYGRILMVPRVKLAYDHVRTARGSSVTREADAAGSACSTSSTPTGGT